MIGGRHLKALADTNNITTFAVRKGFSGRKECSTNSKVVPGEVHRKHGALQLHTAAEVESLKRSHGGTRLHRAEAREQNEGNLLAKLLMKPAG